MEPLSLMFLLSFAVLLLIQFLAMLYHRYIHTHKLWIYITSHSVFTCLWQLDRLTFKKKKNFFNSYWIFSPTMRREMLNRLTNDSIMENYNEISVVLVVLLYLYFILVSFCLQDLHSDPCRVLSQHRERLQTERRGK